MIPGLAETFFAIFDGLCGTVADTGHAVSEVLAPSGHSAAQCDAVGRAALCALTAANAGV